jgi:hypothetical protein
MSGRRTLVLASLAILAVPWASAQAGVRIGIGIGLPFFGWPCYSPPAYVVPAPVVVVPAQAVYVHPAPTVVYQTTAPQAALPAPPSSLAPTYQATSPSR